MCLFRWVDVIDLDDIHCRARVIRMATVINYNQKPLLEKEVVTAVVIIRKIENVNQFRISGKISPSKSIPVIGEAVG